MKEISNYLLIDTSACDSFKDITKIIKYLEKEGYFNEYDESFNGYNYITVYPISKNFLFLNEKPIIKRIEYTVEEFINEFIKENNMETKTVKLTLEQAKELYNQGGNFRIIALGAYSEEELTKPTLPNTWEEFCKNYPRCVGESWLSSGSTMDTLRKLDVGNRDVEDDKNLLPNRKMAEAVLALCQLIQLRDCYNQEWKPDWCDRLQNKFIIFSTNNQLEYDTAWTCSHIMAFKSSMLRDKFYENFKDLLETAKELL